jgi:hypothetical protein
MIEPKALRLGLNLVCGWGSMVEVSSKNHKNFRSQIELLICSISGDNSIGPEEREHLESRLETLLTEVDNAIVHSQDVIVEIG